MLRLASTIHDSKGAHSGTGENGVIVRGALMGTSNNHFLDYAESSAGALDQFQVKASVQSRKCTVDPLMGVSPGALAE